MLNKVKINCAISLHIDFISTHSLAFSQSLKPVIQESFNDTLNLRWTEYKEFRSHNRLLSGYILLFYLIFVTHITYVQFPCMVNLLNIISQQIHQVYCC
jgi:hypothetical protein